MEYFSDRNLGRFDFPEYLRAAGLIVHVHHDHFAHDAPDGEWLPAVAARGWYILSADRDIGRNPAELAAVMRSGAGMLCLIGGAARAEDLARNFVNTHPRIAALIAETPLPFVAKVYRPSPVTAVGEGRPGSVILAMDYSRWLASRRSVGFRP